MASFHLVVMAGGSGTRFWPKSTARRPKQLLGFGGQQTLLQQTIARFEGIVTPGSSWVVTTELLAASVREQAPASTVLAEPQGRNTAPCVYWAARAVLARDPEGVMLVMPSDHHIPDLESFRRTVKSAAELAAQEDVLVTLGVRPTRPETGYGYLKRGKPVQGGAFEVEKFVEKPNESRAEEYVRSGEYLWNGGMFLWRASAILKAFDQHMPEMRKAWEAAGGDAIRAYPEFTATSIDFGVMEKARNVVTFPLDCGWDDLGSWTALESLGKTLGWEKEGGVLSAGELASVDSSGNIIDAPGKWVALLGVKDLIIAQNGDALLVAHKDRAQDIRKVVEATKSKRPDLV